MKGNSNKQKIGFAVLTFLALVLMLQRYSSDVVVTAPSTTGISLRESAECKLVLCVPKTGTSAVEWIAQSLFEHIHAALGEDTVAVKKYKKHALKWDSKTLRLDVFGKHHGILRTDAPEIDVTAAAVECVKQKIPGHSDECLQRIKGLKGYPRAPEEVPKMVFFTTFRDPIATAVSWVYYRRGRIGMNPLSNYVMHNQLCEIDSAELALRYRLVTEVLPDLGYSIHPLFFENMRLKPDEFITEFAGYMGLTINEEILALTQGETSLEHMKKVQRMARKTPGNFSKETYSGLSGRGPNARKVRKGAVQAYIEELNEKALRFCRRQAFFHLPQKLKDFWGFADPKLAKQEPKQP